VTDPPAPRWPGERLGLPESGPRSVARFGRRLGAVCIDWAIATVLSLAATRDGLTTNGLLTSAIFCAEQILFVLLLNGGIGHLLLGMRVVPIRGGRLVWWQPIVRAVLLTLAVPALIWDRDQRGLHDRAAGTVLVRV